MTFRLLRYWVHDRGVVCEDVTGAPDRSLTLAGNGEIVVVGSTNIDLITYTQRVPDAGETVVGDSFQLGFGGKGANQAVMARLLGSRVFMVSCLGDDTYGQMYLDNFASLGVDASHVEVAPGSSGVAPIWVEPDGTNRIIIVPGANGLLTEGQASDAVAAHRNASVVVGQFEVPQAVTTSAFRTAREHRIVTLLNPAPAARISQDLLAVTDWIVPNEIEFALIGGGNPYDDADLARYADDVGCRLLVTLGAEGTALVAVDGTVRRFPAITVDAVDTTGAGDAFVGAFAYGMAAGFSEVESIRLATACASDSVTRAGTQTSFPDSGRCAELIARVGRDQSE